MIKSSRYDCLSWCAFRLVICSISCHLCAAYSWDANMLRHIHVWWLIFSKLRINSVLHKINFVLLVVQAPTIVARVMKPTVNTQGISISLLCFGILGEMIICTCTLRAMEAVASRYVRIADDLHTLVFSVFGVVAQQLLLYKVDLLYRRFLCYLTALIILH